MVIFQKQIQKHHKVQDFKTLKNMKLQILLKSFYIILFFSLTIIMVILFTNVYFDANYLISPTFKIIKWTGINIIIIHFLYIFILIGLMIFKVRLFIISNFYSNCIALILISISLAYSIVYFYDFLKY